jgi:hypothetical protein
LRRFYAVLLTCILEGWNSRVQLADSNRRVRIDDSQAECDLDEQIFRTRSFFFVPVVDV